MKKIIILMIIIILSFPYISLNSNAPENPEPYIYTYPPDNSFGIDVMKEVNWSYFKQLFQTHISFNMKYKRLASGLWVSGNDYLVISRIWNDTGKYWKIKLTLSLPFSMNKIMINISSDLNIAKYIERSGTEVWLNFTIPNTNENYSCMFNWSDIKNIPNLIFSKGVTNGIFWFSILKNSNTPIGTYVFDPTFGYTYEATQNWIGTSDSYERILGAWATVGAIGGYANNIIVKTSTIGGTESYQCALYEYDDYTSSYAGTLLGTTETKNILATEDNTLITFDFVTEPLLLANTKYYILIRMTSESNYDNYIKGSTVSGKSIAKSSNGGSALPFSDPLTGESTNTITPYIYCTYTESEGGWTNYCPSATISGTVNGSSCNDVDKPYFNITSDDDNGNNTWGNITCTNGDVYEWINQGNGTKALQLDTGLECNTTYTIWVNLTDSHCLRNYTFNFKTEGEPFINNVFPTNYDTCVSFSPSCNITVTSPCGSLMDIMFEEYKGTEYLVKQMNNSVGNGTYRWIFSNATECSKTYTWRVTTSYHGGKCNDSGIVYVFDTCDCITCCVTDLNVYAYNDTRIYINWTKCLNSTHSRLERNNTQWWNMGKGTLLYNDTGEDYIDNNLICEDTYYYIIWSWNDTSKIWSLCNDSGNDTTLTCPHYVNHCPNNGVPSPSNQSIGISITVSFWNITIFDLDGNTTSGWLNCSNLETYNWNNLGNGTKSLVLSELAYNTTYWVNITYYDNFCYINKSFWFKTEIFFGNFSWAELEIWLNANGYLKNTSPLNVSMLFGSILFENSQFFLFILITLWIFFVTKYYDTKRILFSIVQFSLTVPLAIGLALVSLSFVFGYILVFMIPIIGLYILSEGLLYNKKEKD